MTSLHVICGFPPSKNPGYAYVWNVVISKAEWTLCELYHWVVAFEVRKIVLKLVQQPVGVNGGFVLKNVTDATGSLTDSR